MSTIDLGRLIVKQTYFIPIPRSKLITLILEELEASDPAIDGVHSWWLAEKHKLSFEFDFDLKYSFVFNLALGMKRNTRACRKLVKEKSKEFEASRSTAYFGVLKKLPSDHPIEVYVSVRKIEENGCICKIECSPVLLYQLRYLKDTKANDFEMQSAFLRCKRFLEAIFEGGLSATLVTEEKKELLKPSKQLLINDSTSHEILSKIEEMLDQATNEVLLCGWIGTILLPNMKEIKTKGVNIRIITHKSSELKGKPGKQDVETARRDLISMIGLDHISIRPECHCRVLIVDNKALIGSMDFNSISLAGTHREIGVYTEDPEIVRTLRRYFNTIFTPLEKTE